MIQGYLFDQDRWVCINSDQNLDEDAPLNKHFWLFASIEYQFLGYWLDKCDKYPDPAIKLIPDSLPFNTQVICKQDTSDVIKKFIQKF